jgi:hypothetical protein
MYSILEKDQPNIANSRMYSYIKSSDIPRAEGFLDVNCGRMSRATVHISRAALYQEH